MEALPHRDIIDTWTPFGRLGSGKQIYVVLIDIDVDIMVPLRR